MPKFYDELNRLDYETEVVNGVVTSFTDYDQRNLNVWYSNNTKYDAQGRIDISTLLYDDGSKTVFDSDQNNSGTWAFTTTVFDKFGALDYRWTYNDDGSSLYYDEDENSSLELNQIWDYFDAQGRLTKEYLYYDNGTYTINEIDEKNEFSYSSYSQLFNTQGQNERILYQLDAGGTLSITYDYDSTKDYQYYLESYDSLNRFDYKVIVGDVGGSGFIIDYDQAGTQSWESILSALDTLGRLDYEQRTNDDGSYGTVDYDQDSTKDWVYKLNNFTFDGQLKDYTVLYDDGHTEHQAFATQPEAGTRSVYDVLGRLDYTTTYVNGIRTIVDNDQDQSQPWTKSTLVYTAGGKLDYVTATLDDGTIQFTDYDQDNLTNYSSFVELRTAGNALDHRTTFFRDGTKVFYDIDQAGAQPWSTYTDDYDNLGRFVRETKYYRDGSHTVYDIDQQNHETWADYLKTFDAAGRLDSVKVRYDDRTSDYLDYDQAGTEVWSAFIDHRNTFNIVTSRDTFYDDGSKATTFNDVNNDYNWANYTNAFHANGAINYVNIQYDNGYSRNIVYNANGSRTEVDTDPSGISGFQKKTTAYDASGRVDSIILSQSDGSSVFHDYDEANAFNWTEIVDVRNGAEQVLSRTTHFDNGSLDEIFHDVANSQAWLEHSIGHDAQGRLTYDKYVYDSGLQTTRVYAADRSYVDTEIYPAGSPQIQLVKSYDVSGRLDYTSTARNDGSYVIVDYDETSTKSWTTTTDTLNSSGVQTGRVIVYDDNSREELILDVGNSQSWTYHSTGYTAGGAVTYDFYQNDNGTTRTTAYGVGGAYTVSINDASASQGWTLEKQFYTAAGVLDAVSRVLTNGNSTYTDYDQASASNVNYYIDTFNAGGGQLSRYNVYDDATTSTLVLDPNNQQTWTYHATGRDTAGKITYDFYQNDNGSTKNTVYSGDGSYYVIENDSNHLDGYLVRKTFYTSSGAVDGISKALPDGSSTYQDFDQASAFAWSSVTDTFNAGGAQVSRHTVNDDGSTSDLFLDPSNTQPWTYHSQGTTTAGATTYVFYQYDNGSTKNTVYDSTGAYVVTENDPSHANGFTLVQSTYTAGGLLDAVSKVAANGTSTYEDFDLKNEHTYSHRIDAFNASNVQTSSTTYYDDGTSTITTNDAANAFAWTARNQGFDAQNHATYDFYQNDNGSTKNTVYDATGAYVVTETDASAANGYSLIRSTYTAGGVLDAVSRVAANGTSSYEDFDLNNEHDYSHLVDNFNANNVQTSRLTYYDNGSSAVTTNDVTNGFSWSVHTEGYDAQNRLDYEFFQNDNGTTRNIDYDQANATNETYRLYDYSTQGAITHTYVLYDNGTFFEQYL